MAEEKGTPDKTLDNEYTLKFKKREWIVIYNLIGWDAGRPRLFTLGDAQIINPILDEIKRFADIQSEKKDPPDEGIIVN